MSSESSPTWETEMLRIHRRKSLTCGWREALIVVVIGALLMLALA